ncbi:uncharacterized protein [Amphiura filiformis]|uniref:uncharacterized protein isoform X1 n=1 Tax=Amphiura filiformis TaxID=82378 RepID=UPI003B215A2A
MDLCVVLVYIFAGILLLSQGAAKRLVECHVNSLRDFCGFAQDGRDSFDWSIKRWHIDVKRDVKRQAERPEAEDPHGFYFSASMPKTGRAGQNAILHTPYYRVSTRSTLSIRFQLRIDTSDETRLNLYVSQTGSRKARIYSSRSRGRGWFGQFRNITVQGQFRISFEAVLSSSIKSAVLFDDVELDVFPQSIQTGNHGNTIPERTVAPILPVTMVTNDSGDGKNDETNDALPMCFIIAFISTTLLVVFLIMCCVLGVYAAKTNSFNRQFGHNYEVIYAEQSTTHTSMESSLQLSLRRQRHRTRTATTTRSSTSRLMQRISCSMSSSRLSNQSSIYAEIAETDCDGESHHDGANNGQVELFFVGDGSPGTAFQNSFFSTLSTTSSEETMIQEPLALNIPEKSERHCFCRISPKNRKTIGRLQRYRGVGRHRKLILVGLITLYMREVLMNVTILPLQQAVKQ